MTRFLLSLDQAVDTVFEALRSGRPGETIVPKAPSGQVIDIVRAMIGPRSIPIEVIGIRPGEKIHEILISEEECRRTSERNGYYVIHSILPEITNYSINPVRTTEYCSSENLLSLEEVQFCLNNSGFGYHGKFVQAR
jgi:UDP-glucose 4-epimerase